MGTDGTSGQSIGQDPGGCRWSSMREIPMILLILITLFVLCYDVVV